jgi:hypothetical protein
MPRFTQYTRCLVLALLTFFALTPLTQAASCGTPEDYKHLDAGDLISELDGNWYSAQWKYGYVTKNGIGLRHTRSLL